jgi:hypothetical protein
MKSRFLAVVGIIAFTLAASAQPASAPQQGTKKNFVATQEKEGRAGRERHPEIRKAISALEAAKNDLKRASHDFGGHRESALKACDEAINQLRQALEYDKK